MNIRFFREVFRSFYAFCSYPLALSQEKASAEIRGEFFRTKSQVNFTGDFSVDFFGLFSLEKIGGKIHQKIHGKIQIGIWELRGQNPHCRNLALALSDFYGEQLHRKEKNRHGNSKTLRRVLRSACSLVAHDCGYHLSRYTCRATRVAADFLDFTAFCRCSTGVALHPLKILVSHLPPPPVPGGVAPKFGSEKVSRYTGVSQLQLRVSRYTVQLRLVLIVRRGRKTVRIVKTTTVARYYGFKCRSNFSMEGFLGWEGCPRPRIAEIPRRGPSRVPPLAFRPSGRLWVVWEFPHLVVSKLLVWNF